VTNGYPPNHWTRITSLECHAAGEPLRIITGGWPELPGETILQRRRYQLEHHDDLRRALMFEPRGHADMYGCILTPPVTPGADRGVIFMHNEGYSTMCGHGIIGLSTALLETGMLPIAGPETVVRFDTPAGLVTARATVESGRVTGVAFENVPSFVLALDRRVHVPGVGPLLVDVAFGGAFYAFCRAADVGLGLRVEDHRELIRLGMEIKRAVIEAMPIEHPLEKDLGFLYGTIFLGEPQGRNAQSRNVCIFAEGEVDRSPTGTGVSARCAIHYARGELALGEPMTVESILGTRFTVKALRTTTCGPLPAVVPEVHGRAHLTGRCEWWLDPDDPLRDGFVIR